MKPNICTVRGVTDEHGGVVTITVPYYSWGGGGYSTQYVVSTAPSFGGGGHIVFSALEYRGGGGSPHCVVPQLSGGGAGRVLHSVVTRLN